MSKHHVYNDQSICSHTAVPLATKDLTPHSLLRLRKAPKRTGGQRKSSTPAILGKFSNIFWLQQIIQNIGPIDQSLDVVGIPLGSQAAAPTRMITASPTVSVSLQASEERTPILVINIYIYIITEMGKIDIFMEKLDRFINHQLEVLSHILT